MDGLEGTRYMIDSYYVELLELESIVQGESGFELEYAEKLSLNTAIEKLRMQITSSSLVTGKAKVTAESIWEDWFDTVKADVFISHSSANKGTAVQFANWLYRNFGLKSFVDSQFWLKINDLQAEFDKTLMYKKTVLDEYGLPHKECFYSYAKRNQSTAHVHALLSYALTKMIQKTPYFIFIKSKDSVSFEDSIENLTSPWIFHELAVVDLLLNAKRELLYEKAMEFSQPEVLYPMLGNCLKELNADKLKIWKKLYEDKKNAEPFSILEDIFLPQVKSV